MSIVPIIPISAAPEMAPSVAVAPLSIAAPSTTAFSQFLTEGLENANEKVLNAERTVKAFVLDDSIPVHQVSFALAQAKLSLELMLQVRSRLVEGYQQLMNMQM